MAEVAAKKNWIILVIAVAIGVAAMFAANTYINFRIASVEANLKRDMEMIKVVVPQHDLARGVRIVGDDLAIREVPKTYVSQEVVTPDAYSVAEGQRVVAAVDRGKPLLWAHLEGGQSPAFSGKLTVGKRAITFPVDEINSISGMLQPGDKIDLIATIRQLNNDVTYPLLQDVQILATGTQLSPRDDDGNGRQSQFTTVTLQVEPENANKIILAQEVGKLTAVLRNPDDERILAATKLDISSLLGTKKTEQPKRRSKGVEFIIGGVSQ